jgi:hypothetical protein
MNRPFRTLAARMIVVGVATAASSSCTLLWLFTSDPEGLPCDFSVDPLGQCLEGYTCVVRDNESVCLRANALNAGDPCLKTDQCDEDLLCATQFAQCGADSDDLNCALVGEDAEAPTCRPICDITQPNTCPSDQRCYVVDGVEGVNGFCQQGVCATDTDCTAVAGVRGICANELGGKTGLCLQECDPLACDRVSRTCPACTGTDGAADVEVTCGPVPDEFLSNPPPGTLNPRTVCLPVAGALPAFSDCTAAPADCDFGTFCISVDGVPPYCAPWCDVGGGNPACDAPATCQAILQGSDVGYCL